MYFLREGHRLSQDVSGVIGHLILHKDLNMFWVSRCGVSLKGCLTVVGYLYNLENHSLWGLFSTMCCNLIYHKMYHSFRCSMSLGADCVSMCIQEYFFNSLQYSVKACLSCNQCPFCGSFSVFFFGHDKYSSLLGQQSLLPGAVISSYLVQSDAFNE